MLVEYEQISCFYYKGNVCHANSHVPLFSQCASCSYRIENLSRHIIMNRFNSEKYILNQIYFKLIERDIVTEDDLFANPFYHSLRKIRYPDLEKKEKLMFNIYNLSSNEYSFEIFELELKELPEFIWHLEEFGYSDTLLSKFKENVIELHEAIVK